MPILFILLLIPLATLAAQEQPLHLLITIDTETSSGCNGKACNPVPMEERIYGRRGDKEYGIPLIMLLLERHGMRGTFFVNSTLDAAYPDEAIREMVQSIVRRGHDVQLHIHPEFRCFKFCKRDDIQCRRKCISGDSRLAGNPAEKQKALIEEGLDNLERWAGYRPITFRAGSFAADLNTLAALREAGVVFDSSVSGHGHPLASHYALNTVTSDEGLIELPVYDFISLSLPGYEKHRHFDPESTTFEEMRSILEQALDHEAGTVMTIMHSFSFCRPEGGCPNERAIHDFDRLLGWVEHNAAVKVLTVRDWIEAYHENPAKLTGSGYIPETGYWLTLWRSWQRWNEGPKNRLFVIANLMILVLLLGTLVLLIRAMAGRGAKPTTENRQLKTEN